jgi:transcription elongation factor Elf1/uncharacterized membrane protein
MEEQIEKRFEKLEDNLSDLKEEITELKTNDKLAEANCKSCKEAQNTRVGSITQEIKLVSDKLDKLHQSISNTKDGLINTDKNLAMITKEVTDLVAFRNQINYKFWKIVFIIIASAIGILATYFYNMHVHGKELVNQQLIDQRLEQIIRQLNNEKNKK